MWSASFVKCVVHSVHSTVCSLQCAVCSVHFAVCSVQCTMSTLQCAVYIVQCTHKTVVVTQDPILRVMQRLGGNNNCHFLLFGTVQRSAVQSIALYCNALSYSAV